MFGSHRAPLALVAAVVALLAIPAALADTPYADPAGDSNGAPDITQIVVSNDAAGVVTFRVTTAAPIVGNSVVFVDIDSDSNPGTGSFGAEYSIIAGLGGFGLQKWNGTDFVDASAPSLNALVSGTTVEIKIGRQDIGNVSRFGFSAAAVLFDASTFDYVSEDDAPDGGEYIYVLTFTQCANGKDDDGDGKIDGQDLGCSSATDNNESDDPVTLKAGRPVVIPAKARAGKFVVVGAPVVRVETGKPISSGRVTCSARIGTKRLPAGGRVDSGFALCGFDVPAKAKGKLVSGTITVTVLGTTKVIPFSFRAN
jgi:hypothetical protein